MILRSPVPESRFQGLDQVYTARRFTCPAAVAATLVLAARAISAATAAPTLPQPSAYNKLSSVSCLSAANCWAVGSAQDSNNNITGEILHWTGASWSAVSAPAAGGALNSISCSTLSSCWAVGNVGNGQTFPRPLSVRWNGSTWTAVPSPKLAKEVLHAVSCTSSTSCWAVGDYALGRKTFAMHWNGRR
jgi:hypothetical protein